MLFGQIKDEAGIVARRQYFWPMADDLRIFHQGVQLFIVQRDHPARVETEKGLFESVPFLFDHFP